MDVQVFNGLQVSVDTWMTAEIIGLILEISDVDTD